MHIKNEKWTQAIQNFPLTSIQTIYASFTPTISLHTSQNVEKKKQKCEKQIGLKKIIRKKRDQKKHHYKNDRKTSLFYHNKQ
jgi:hypothetical protein